MKIDYIGKCLLIEEKGERVLVIGDLHLGYEGAMRASGVMIPVKLYNKCIADFDLIIFKVGGFVENIVILGDIKHEFGFILNDEWNLIVKFIEYVRAKCSKLVIIEGNHDV
ncbi:MAG: metallophosphoesterase, partial [Nanoarchaeota archaeon]